MQLHEQLNGGCDTSSEALRILQMEFRHAHTHFHVERVYVYANFNSRACYAVHPSIYLSIHTHKYLCLQYEARTLNTQLLILVVVKFKELTFGEEEKN